MSMIWSSVQVQEIADTGLDTDPDPAFQKSLDAWILNPDS